MFAVVLMVAGMVIILTMMVVIIMIMVLMMVMVVILIMVIVMVMVLLIGPMMVVMVTPMWALMVAFVVAWSARLVTGISLLHHRTLLLHHLHETLRVNGELLVHPGFVGDKLSASLVARCILASRMAFLKSWQIVASLHHCLHHWGPALVVASGILSALLVARTRLLVFIVVVAMVVVIVVTMVVVMVAPMRALVVAVVVAWSASLVASMSLLHHRTLLLQHLHEVLWVLGELVVHPFFVKLDASLVARCILATCMAFLQSR